MENVMNELAMLRSEMQLRGNDETVNRLENVMDELEALRDELP